jgi:hypothetical protein
MTLADLLRLPPGVMAGVLLLLWPAIWAGALITYALYSDVIRKKRPPRPVRKAA